MITVLASRLLQGLLVMLTVTALAFLMFRFVGDPVQTMSREDATPQEKAELRASLGLDLPVPVQYARFVGRVVQGDLGISYRNQRPVARLIAERLPATMELVLAATLLALAFGIPLGVLAALRPDGVVARAVQALSLIGISSPCRCSSSR